MKLPFVIIICFFCTVPLLSSIPPLLNPSPPQPPPPRSLPSLTPPLRNPSPLQRAGITSFCFFGKREFSSGHPQGVKTLWFMLHMIDHPLPCMMIAVMGEATSCRIRPSAEEGSCPWNLPPGWSERSYHPGRWSDLILGEARVRTELRTNACTVFRERCRGVGRHHRQGSSLFPTHIGFQILRKVSSYQVLGFITPHPLPSSTPPLLNPSCI